MTKHSPLGASGAERWLACPGSVSLLKELKLPESDEPDYQKEGTAGHEAAAHCLNQGLDTWEIVGDKFNDIVIDAAMAEAVQVYLDYVRPIMDGSIRTHVEAAVSSPVHPDFYGTVDFGAVLPPPGVPHCPLGSAAAFTVVDLKMGKGIMVEIEDNPQLKYYAFGLIDGIERQNNVSFHEDTPVSLAIVQPRGFHHAGPIREWATTWGEIRGWVLDTLVPAMVNAELDNTLDVGPHCRFCPAKLVCPMLTGLFRAAATYDPKEIVNVGEESLGLSYQYLQGVKFYIKALEEEVFRRLSAGKVVPGTVLVNKRANRVFKSEVDGKALADVMGAEFGADAFTIPELKGPPDIEKLGPKGKEFVKRWAYKPETGLTVALASDKSAIPVKVKSLTENFQAALDHITGPEGS